MIPSVGAIRVPTAVSVPPTRTVQVPPAPSTAVSSTIVEISPAATVKQMYAAGISIGQIAARTGLPVDTVKKFLGIWP